MGIRDRYKDIDSLVIGYIPEKQDIHFVFRNCGNNIRPQTANVVILRKTIFEMRYEQPVTPIAVFLQQIVRPLGMNDDRRKSFGVSLSDCLLYTSGIDILISAVNSLEPELRCKANVIIAGKDFDGTVHRVQPSDKAAFKIVLRHIEDDELVYLYEHTDYVAVSYTHLRRNV